MKKPAAITQQIHDLVVDVRELIERHVMAFEDLVEIDGRRLELEERGVVALERVATAVERHTGLARTMRKQAVSRTRNVAIDDVSRARARRMARESGLLVKDDEEDPDPD